MKGVRRGRSRVNDKYVGLEGLMDAAGQTFLKKLKLGNALK